MKGKNVDMDEVLLDEDVQEFIGMVQKSTSNVCSFAAIINVFNLLNWWFGEMLFDPEKVLHETENNIPSDQKHRFHFEIGKDYTFCRESWKYLLERWCIEQNCSVDNLLGRK